MPVFPLVESSRILPGPNLPLARAFGDDVRGGAVLDRSAGIEPLCFAEQFDSGQVASQPLQAQQRSVADELEAALAERLRPARDRTRFDFGRASIEESGTCLRFGEAGRIDGLD